MKTCAIMWYDRNEMQQLLEKYVDNLLTINFCLFYIDSFVYCFRKNVEPVTLLHGKDKSSLYNTRLATRDH